MPSVLDFLNTLYQPECGLWKFSDSSAPSLLATGQACLALEHAGELRSLPADQLKDVGDALLSRQRTDGSFEEPLIASKDAALSHGPNYAQDEINTFCQQTLHALGVETTCPRTWNDKRDQPDGVCQYFESISWENPWRDSNYVMFLLSQLTYDYVIHGKKEYEITVHSALDWLDEKQDPKTGMWQGKSNLTPRNAMAAWFHFTFYYQFFDRKMNYLDQIVDTCLGLQTEGGLFGNPGFGSAIGQTCLDYDAIDLLVLSAVGRDYRRDEVTRCLESAIGGLELLRNQDGGWANAKYSRQSWLTNRVARRMPTFISQRTGYLKSDETTYNVCASFMRAKSCDSNPFSTWFRPLAISVANKFLGRPCTATVRSLPFLVYHSGFSK